MVAVKVRAHHEVDLFRSSARGFEILQEDATGHLIPTLRNDPSASCLAVADACVDQDRVMSRSHQKGLDHERQISEYGTERVGLKPPLVRFPVPGLRLREESQRVEIRFVGLDNSADRDVSKLSLKHGRLLD
jgi:hypothetical protein